MMRRFLIAASLLALTACGSSHRPTYSGHEESTIGVPGFDANGKKMSPNVKLGQSYTVDGETYVPRYQPDYVEEGLASWYGPGFHGGKTANGESFDKEEMTAAHRTLPLPSIVKVTLLSNGKSAIVRINDRGPFAKGRIIDLSRAAAEKIGLIAVGVGKVRVEYMPAESARFAQLLSDGRSPKSIDLDSDVLEYAANNRTQPTAFNAAPAGDAQPQSSSWLSRLSPVSSATAAEAVAPLETDDPNAGAPAPVGDNPDSVSASDLPPSSLPMGSTVAPAAPASIAASSQPVIVPKGTYPPAGTSASAPPMPASLPPVAAAVAGNYVQLGAFGSKANADILVGKVADIGQATVSSGMIPNGQTIYRVRMGPFPDADAATQALNRLQARGVDARPVRE